MTLRNEPELILTISRAKNKEKIKLEYSTRKMLVILGEITKSMYTVVEKQKEQKERMKKEMKYEEGWDMDIVSHNGKQKKDS